MTLPPKITADDCSEKQAGTSSINFGHADANGQTLDPWERHIRDEYLKFSPDEARITEKQLKRNLDMRLFPSLMIMYILNYVDRNALPIAKLAGISEELGLSSTQFGTAISILFFWVSASVLLRSSYVGTIVLLVK